MAPYCELPSFPLPTWKSWGTEKGLEANYRYDIGEVSNSIKRMHWGEGGLQSTLQRKQEVYCRHDRAAYMAPPV